MAEPAPEVTRGARAAMPSGLSAHSQMSTAVLREAAAPAAASKKAACPMQLVS